MSKAPDFLFDIGNVILFFDWTLFTKAIEDECDYTSDELLKQVFDANREAQAHTMETEAFLELAFKATGYRGTREKFVRAWQEIFTLNQPMADFVAELKEAGHRLILFSNTNQLHVDYFMNEYAVFDLFDHAVFSHEIGAAKPDKPFYEHAIQEFGVDPAQTVYYDDLEKNIIAGNEIGFRSVQYSGQPIDELRVW